MSNGVSCTIVMTLGDGSVAEALIDSGATRNFIAMHFVRTNRKNKTIMQVTKYTSDVKVTLGDGKTQVTSIGACTVSVMHQSCTPTPVTVKCQVLNMQQTLVLGVPWLRQQRCDGVSNATCCLE